MLDELTDACVTWTAEFCGVDADAVRGRNSHGGNSGSAAAEQSVAPSDEAAPGEAPGASAEGHGKLATEIDVLTLKLIEHPTKYGAIRITGTLKANTTSTGEGEVATTYTANDAKKRASGVKKAFSFAEMEKASLLGFAVTGVKLELETEASDEEILVGATLSFEVKTGLFKAPAKSSNKLVLVKYSKKEGFAPPSLELSIVQAPTTIVTGSVATVLSAELKGVYGLDKEKVLKEVGKDVIKKVVKGAVEKEAKRLGVKVLGREAGAAILKDLGPVAAAFSVGMEIGSLLNEYTVAPQVAMAVDETILGDLNERYQAADTLGKMWLLSKNSPKIVLALIASGVAGAVSGMADVVLFKIMSLPTAADYAEAFENFSKGLTEAAQLAKAVGDNTIGAIGGAMFHTAFMVGIKCNPKHAICAHAALEPVIAALFATLRPMYAGHEAGKAILVRVSDASFDETGFEKFAGFAQRSGMQYRGMVNLADAKSMANSLRAMTVNDFLGFLEANHMIKYNIKISADLNPDNIDPKLVEELVAG